MAKTFVDSNRRRRFSDSGKQVSRWVAKKTWGKIGEDRVVHHKDGNSLNNRPSNLKIMSRSSHSSHHAKKRGWW